MNIQLATLLSDIQKEIEEKIPNINRGGCGFFALYLSEQLLKNKIPHELIMASYYFDNVINELDSNRKIINCCEIFNKRTKVKLPFDHVFVKIQQYYIDGVDINNRFPKEEIDYNCGIISYKDLELHIKYGRWSSQFNKRLKPKLKRIIEQKFKTNLLK